MIDAGLKDRVVLITGSNHGIGAATARACAKQGAREAEEEILLDIPLRRIGEPRGIADAMVSLASERACWMVGRVIKVSGGHAI
jgi:NAD(P)-dependent dehydrogenase (short-subunit alcohol dehydrogenase family)